MEKPTVRRLPPYLAGFGIGIKIPFLNRDLTLFQWNRSDPHKAVDKARKIVGAHPMSVEAHTHLANCLLLTGEFDEAIEEGRKSLALLASDSVLSDRYNVATTHNLIGLNLQQNGRRGEARSAWAISAALMEDGPGEDAREYLEIFPAA
jgi:Flp pilus assembly protein TadD